MVAGTTSSGAGAALCAATNIVQHTAVSTGTAAYWSGVVSGIAHLSTKYRRG